MKFQERIMDERPQLNSAGPNGSGDLATFRAQGMAFIEAGEQAISRALSTDSEAFLRANLQKGGE